MKKFLNIIIFSIFFSFLIFFIKNYFFGDIKKIDNNIEHIETNYIDPVIKQEKEINEKEKEIKNKIKEKITRDYNAAKIIDFYYIPKDFKQEISEYSINLGTYLKTEYILNKIKNLKIEIYEDLIDVRGKMKNKTVKLFGIKSMSQEEFLGVFTHEFAHYIDLYYLEKKVFKDLSDYFYEISWKKTKIIKAGQEQKDFVSGYSMTNKYEDFAESFTYYVLHNKDFLEKTKTSNILLKKYNFFEKNIFIHKKFKNTDFSQNNIIKDYYRDITKIEYDLKIFLQYLKN